VAVGFTVGAGDFVGVGLGVAVRIGVGVGVGLGVGLGVLVGLGVAVGLGAVGSSTIRFVLAITVVARDERFPVEPEIALHDMPTSTGARRNA